MRDYIDMSGPLFRVLFQFDGKIDCYRINQDKAILLVGLLTEELANLEELQRKSGQNSLEVF